MKLEDGLTAETEEALVAKGWTRPSNKYKNNNFRGRGNKTGRGGVTKRPINPVDEEGERLVCRACGSYRHMLGDCPHSWEKLQKNDKVYTAENVEDDNESEEETFFIADFQTNIEKLLNEDDKVDDVILYTGNNKKKTIELGSETLGCALLDCGCTSNVCGNDWWNSYRASLLPEDRKKVRVEDGGNKKFRFGGGEILAATKFVTFPAQLAGRRITFKCHVVNSGIPLLWSKPSMTKAGVVLDLPNDKAKILGLWVDLDLTTAGHYSIDITPGNLTKEELCLLTLPEDKAEKDKTLRKIHRQFGHPLEEVMIRLLKKVNSYDEDTKQLVTAIYVKCKTCKKFKKTPPRPVVSLPAASEFNEVLTMDLKEVKVGRFKYILHLIDGFTRLTVSVFIENKNPQTIIHNVMKNWLLVGYGRPGRIWSDNGGEFNNEMMREMGEAIGCKLETGAGYAAWMNGLNERNHSVVDRCFAKIMKDDPKLDPTIALAWAVTAKNSFAMHGGFSSFQLVFGKEPKLPDIMTDKLPALSGTTTSESLAAHINAMYAGRKAFSEAQCDEKIRRALRHKVRAVERRYNAVEEVFSKQDGDKGEWRGPATVIGNKGSVHYLVHQGSVIRVAACRLVTTGEADDQLGTTLEQQTVTKHVNTELSVKNNIDTRATNNNTNQEINQNHHNTEGDAQNDNQNQDNDNQNQNNDDQNRDNDNQNRDDGDTPENEPPVDNTQQEKLSRRTERQPASSYPRAGDRIQQKVGDDWQNLEVLGRGGKASSKTNYDYYNVKREDNLSHGVHLDTIEWRRPLDNITEVAEDNNEEEVNLTTIPSKNQGTQECIDAKTRELKAFDEFNVYEEVEDHGQDRLSSRWVLTDKSTNKEIKVKARLVCRGFEEMVEVQTDSPTGSKETLHILLAVAAANNWKIRSADVKNAYLQGEQLDREVFMEPPAERKKPNTIWRLNKSVYGMNDAGRKWFLKVEEVLKSLKCQKSSLDHCLFYYRVNNKLEGILLLWVDDIFHAGSDIFRDDVMKKVAREFLIGRTEEETFKYIGLGIETTAEGITLDQIDYIRERLEPAVLRGGDNKRPLEKEEAKLLRRLTGQINWTATQSRPDLSYTVVELSTKFRNPTLEDLKKANKAISVLSSTHIKLMYPKMKGNLQIITHSDAAFRNLPDKISSGRGHVVFLTGDKNQAALIAWASNKVKRVVGSTVAAEALSLQTAISHAIYLRAILTEMLGNESSIPIKSYIDSNNLYQAVYSTKFVEDKRLRIDIAQIQECIKEENVEIRWVESKRMLADCLTKRGVNPNELRTVIESGALTEKNL